ncbi:MAG: hypothetical protein ACFFBV_11055 [Promethearchaeota archaeon]
MIEEEKFKSIIQEIKDIYLYLTQGEPSPDDEITAREKLIKMIETLKTVNSSHVGSNMRLFEDTLSKLDKWDTLEFWFIESELPELIQKIISITEEIPEFKVEEYKETPTTQMREDLDKASLDIDEIVGKVSEQFKGEIDDLKQEIDVLKLELEKKDETIKQATQKKVIKKIIPKKDVKLPPPKIKIPVIKTPEKPPKVKAPGISEAEKPKVKIEGKSIEQVQSKIEEELEKIKAPPVFQEKSKIKQESETPEFTEMPEKPKKSKVISEIIEIDVLEEEKDIPFSLQEPKTVEKSEEIEEPEIVQKPKITSVSIEEVEAEDVSSTGTDLFNVFSSVGEKPIEKLPTLDDAFAEPSVKEKKKKEDKKKKKETKKTDTMPFVDFSGAESEIEGIDEYETSDVEELPTDKDSLYQELIALEGKRYSLEKSFKDVEKSYNTGSIDDLEYQKQSDELRLKLESITTKINKIRRVISSL